MVHLKYARGKSAPFITVLLVTILLTSFSAMPGVPLSNNKIHYKALAQEQLNNEGQGTERGNNITTVAGFNASEGQLPEGLP